LFFTASLAKLPLNLFIGSVQILFSALTKAVYRLPGMEVTNGCT